MALASLFARLVDDIPTVLSAPPLGRQVSTLFPYTTLFRSVNAGRHLVRVELEGGRERRKGDHARGRRPAQDRKSTRLNSSHVERSYAVFCLKKKRRSTSRTATTRHARWRSPRSSRDSSMTSPQFYLHHR